MASAGDHPDLFESEQLEMELELEDWTLDQVESQARDWRRRADGAELSQERRAAFALRILSALMKSRVIDAAETRAKLSAWCRGAGVPLEDVQRQVEQTLSRARGR
jgi:hypothetical protein